MAKRGGLTKSEALQVRFDPLLRWAVEILAGRERRTLSATIEWAVERAVKEIPVSEKNNRPLTPWQIADQCWHPNPVWRLHLFASQYPELLTFDERNKWQALLFLIGTEQHLEREQHLEPKTPSPGHLIHVDWLPALSAVWPYIVANANNLDFGEMRRLYLEARQA